MHVVIVGGGFGGIKTALELGKAQIGSITLISKKSYFLHPSTLCATATGKNTEDAAVSLDDLFANMPNVKVIKDTITGINYKGKMVTSKKHKYPYDKLVLALGSTTSFNGIEGLSKHALGVKNLAEVRAFQSRINDSLAEGKLNKEYFVIGAGLTGVELAAALSTYLKRLKALYSIKGEESRVTLVESKDRITPNLSKTASKKITKRLNKMGVRILTGKTVTALNGNAITIGSKVYPTETAIWTSGSAIPAFYKNYPKVFWLSKTNGRVRVSGCLTAAKDVYVLGDNNELKYGNNYISTLRQAKHTAKNLVKIARGQEHMPFKDRKSSVSVPLGNSWGYVEYMGVYIDGRLGYRIRRLIELSSYLKIMPLKTALPIWRSHNIVDVDDVK